MRPSYIVALLLIWATWPAQATVPLEGCLAAERACPALTSIRRPENPDGLTLEPGRSYPLIGKNKDDPTHYRIRVEAAVPAERWVEVACGRPEPACPSASPAPDAPEPPPPAVSGDFVLAVTWQPAFCQLNQTKPECRSQTPERPDAGQLSLHGLWPQPRERVYCGLDPEFRDLDTAGKWGRLPALPLSDATRRELTEAMPGVASGLDRHEWYKHGTCHGGAAEDYYRDSLILLGQLNRSEVRRLFAENIGRRLSAAAIRRGFDQAFGRGAGTRVTMKCDAGMISELQIHLRGVLGSNAALADLMSGDEPVAPGCREGRVDAAGF